MAFFCQAIHCSGGYVNDLLRRSLHRRITVLLPTLATYDSAVYADTRATDFSVVRVGDSFFHRLKPATLFSVSCARDFLFVLLRRCPGFPSPKPAIRYSATSAGGSFFSAAVAGDSFCRCSHRRPTSPLPAPRTHHSISSANSELIRHRR